MEWERQRLGGKARSNWECPEGLCDPIRTSPISQGFSLSFSSPDGGLVTGDGSMGIPLSAFVRYVYPSQPRWLDVPSPV